MFNIEFCSLMFRWTKSKESLLTEKEIEHKVKKYIPHSDNEEDSDSKDHNFLLSNSNDEDDMDYTTSNGILR